jgi:hypothetical protein
VEITDLVPTVGGMVLVATVEEMALVGIRGRMDLVGTTVGLVLEEEIAEVLQITGEADLVLEAV